MFNTATKQALHPTGPLSSCLPDCVPRRTLAGHSGEPAVCKLQRNSHQKPTGQRLFLDLGILRGNHFLLQMSPRLEYFDTGMDQCMLHSSPFCRGRSQEEQHLPDVSACPRPRVFSLGGAGYSHSFRVCLVCWLYMSSIDMLPIRMWGGDTSCSAF